MNIAFYLLDIEQNNIRHQEILKAINNLCSLRPYDNIVIFNNNFNTIDINQKYYLLSINHAKYFRGLLFLFDTEHAMLTRTFPGPDKQFICMNKPTWTENTNIPFSVWYSVYMDHKFELLVDSEYLYDLVDTCWKKPFSKSFNLTAENIDNVIRQLS